METLCPDAVKSYSEITQLLEQLTKESNKLAEYQKCLVQHNMTISHLNKSFNKAQSKLERVAAAKCGGELLNM